MYTLFHACAITLSNFSKKLPNITFFLVACTSYKYYSLNVCLESRRRIFHEYAQTTIYLSNYLSQVINHLYLYNVAC